MRLLILGGTLIICTLLLISMPALFDNRDLEGWNEQNSIFVSNPRRNLAWDLHSSLAKSEQESEETFREIMTGSSNICLGGKDATKLTKTEYIKTFMDGPCSPVVLVPGLAGTSLQVIVDCETLQKESPQIFASCGWSTCNPYEFWSKRPDSEYRLWISTSTSPVGIIQTSKKDHCFGDVMEILYNPDEPIPSKRYTNPAGLTITYYGNTPKTQGYNECGFNGISDMTDDHIVKMLMCDYKGFKNIGALLKNMGYMSGLTFQSVPYDYRKSLVASESQDIIKKSLDNFHYITGKKSVIITHSLGSLHTLKMLYGMGQEEKDEKIATLMTIGGPYLGSSKSVRSNLGGDPGYLDHVLGRDVGINYYSQNKVMNSASSSQDIYPKDTFIRFRNEPWLQEILKRIEMEKEFEQTKQLPEIIPLSWFPTPDMQCNKGLPDRSENCMTLMSDLSDHFLTVNQTTYRATIEDIQKILKVHSVNSTKLLKYYEETYDEQMNDLAHPGVPTVVVYASHSKVENQFLYKSNPKERVEQTLDFYFPDETTYQFGDMTVLSSSAMTPAIKWIYEHKQGKTQYPVKLVEFCSIHANDQLYDSKDGLTNERRFKQSGYMGINCECMNGNKGINECKHSCMINDKNIVDFILNLIQTQETTLYKNGVSPMSEEQLQKFVNECQNLK